MRVFQQQEKTSGLEERISELERKLHNLSTEFAALQKQMQPSIIEYHIPEPTPPDGSVGWKQFVKDHGLTSSFAKPSLPKRVFFGNSDAALISPEGQRLFYEK